MYWSCGLDIFLWPCYKIPSSSSSRLGDYIVYNAPCGACTIFSHGVLTKSSLSSDASALPWWPHCQSHRNRYLSVYTSSAKTSKKLLELLTSCWQTLKLQASLSSAPGLKHLDIKFYSSNIMFNSSDDVFNSLDACFNSLATSQSGRMPAFDDQQLVGLLGQA